jgi:glycosyltransferase involved in cell wall biosynthesis
MRVQERILVRYQRVYVPSKRALNIYTRFGVVTEKWRLVPHAVRPQDESVGEKTEKYVFVGRLSSEKGIDRLLEFWPRNVALDVIGDGDLDTRKYAERKEISFLGRIPRENVMKELSTYRALVFSSSAPESALPLVALESLSLGLPIIAVDHNTVADAIREGEFGVVLPPLFTGDDLAKCVFDLESRYDFFCDKAKSYSLQNHNYDSWILSYLESYHEVLSEQLH